MEPPDLLASLAHEKSAIDLEIGGMVTDNEERAG
jgi:hypothetical protein